MQLALQTGVIKVKTHTMMNSMRRLLGLGLLGAMLVTAVPTFAAPQRGGKKTGRKGGKGGGKRGGSKGAPKKSGRGGSK